MKKLAFTLAALAALTGSAVAADMPVKAYTKAPPPIVAYNWTGCYVGGYAGGAVQSRAVQAQDPSSTGGTFPAGTFYNSPFANAGNGGAFGYDMQGSAIGGGTLGCNWQGPSSPFVLGLEAEGGYMRLRGSAIDPYSVGFGSDTVATTKVGDWYAVLAGRAGYAWDRTLLYVKGGVGFADVKSSVIDACTTAPCGGGTLNATSSDTRAFWVVGGGIEYAFAANWTVKGEYLYLGLDNNYSVCGAGGASAAGSAFCGNHNVEGIHTGKIGINYKFGGPIVARY
ncbi:porin family protein [Bradyrhizobium genosp. L]|uniref:outer membrane protein n=1 Tax=Bradyrhizobium genosp. L TaxID=83637 RepID=UPI0018A2DF3B|nr:outer membrane beta-barrel protein [Bradyrhizobium genosp. L]QPF85534.1 porin family protein [Bradyrhizobium genosp. L]